MIVLGIDTGCGVARPTCGVALIDTASPPTVRYLATLRREQVLALPLGDVELVALEVPEGYAHGPRARAKVSALLGCANLAVDIAARVGEAGVPVVRVAAPAVRSALGIRVSARRSEGVQTVDARIAVALRQRLGPLPRCSVHARDALAAALYASQRARIALAAGHGPACDLGAGVCGVGCPKAGGRPETTRETAAEAGDYPRTRVQRQKKAHHGA